MDLKIESNSNEKPHLSDYKNRDSFKPKKLIDKFFFLFSLITKRILGIVVDYYPL